MTLKAARHAMCLTSDRKINMIHTAVIGSTFLLELVFIKMIQEAHLWSKYCVIPRYCQYFTTRSELFEG